MEPKIQKQVHDKTPKTRLQIAFVDFFRGWFSESRLLVSSLLHVCGWLGEWTVEHSRAYQSVEIRLSLRNGGIGQYLLPGLVQRLRDCRIEDICIS